MDIVDDARPVPRAAYVLLVLVALCLLFQVGALVSSAMADAGGGASASTVVPDTLSDSVGATAAEFRVDESGAATYSIPLYAVPGTAGVSPKLALSYSSQGGYGPLGKGWSISGLSAISRCRATREAGDFISNGTPTDGTPSPINFTATDRFCLDGQRLVPAQANSAACPGVSGMTAQNLRTEIESFQRVCAYTPTGGTDGPAFFAVDRKDGSRSWYGDRDNDATANRPDAYFNSTATGHTNAALSWAQTRFQDSNGNYIDFDYYENLDGVVGEQLIKDVRYTGKTVLAGQVGAARAPFAQIVFTYALRAAADRGVGYASGGQLTQAHKLTSVVSCATGGSCTTALQARAYVLGYIPAMSGNGMDELVSIKECRDTTAAVCLGATQFSWATGKYDFSTQERPANLPTGSLSKFEGFKMGDIDGDGRQDMVYLKDGSSGEACATENVLVLFAIQDSAGMPSYTQSAPICTPAELMTGRGDGSWHLLDYDGDGRDDLLVSGPAGTGWRIYPSQGRAGNANFDTSRNLLASLSPAIPSSDSPGDQVQLADLNGDGLIDILYPSGGVLKARIMERGASGFGWGAERTVTVDMSTLGSMPPACGFGGGATCTRTLSGAPSNKTGYMQLADFNGDAASDVLLGETQVVTQYTGAPGCQPQPQIAAGGARAGLAVLPFVDSKKLRQGIVNDPCYSTTVYQYQHTMTVRTVTATSITIGSINRMFSPYDLQLADINGDGLTDMFYRASSTSGWMYKLNTGAGFTLATSLPMTDFLDQTKFVDVNGDGRADILHPVNLGDYKTYNVMYALPGGGFSAEQNLPGMNARLCEGTGCDNTRKVPIFGDLDGDGSVDFMSLKMEDNADVYISRSAVRYAPRDVITRVTNGLGAITDLRYLPLTLNAVYWRGNTSRNGTNWGRGSAVQDFLAPNYVVYSASSSSPQTNVPSAMATVRYRYSGGRIQGGGRGFLGFATIETIDTNHNGGYVVTTTNYAQNFPFVGMPVSTVKRAVLNQTYAPSPCLTGITDACFSNPGQAFASLGGSWFSDASSAWEADTDISATDAGFSPGVQAPVHVRTAGTEEKQRDPIGGAQTGRIVTTFDYGAYGNATTTTVDTYNATDTTPGATVITNNTYTDNPAAWRLGRLTASTVTHRRPSRTDVVRTTSFAYAMAAPVTGQLTAERIQPNGAVDQDLRKEYTYDEYGNRTVTETCANPATSCSTAIAFHPSAATVIQRYSRTAYDAAGRYPVATYEPFWNGAGATERATQTVVARNIFGDVTQAYDVNGRDVLAVTGTLGRAYYTWSETVAGSAPGTPSGGVASVTSYRWCGTATNQVNCPTGAAFRQKVAADASPTQWTYYDVLGRPVLKLTQSFNESVSGKDVTGVCTSYDATGKPQQVSNPFFLGGVVSGDPNGLATVCTSGRAWTTTLYDVLNRPTDVETPDGSVVSTDYVGSTTVLTDARGNVTKQVRNALGELTQVIDANGLSMTYWYLADGSNYLVSRDAGRGSFQNQFFFDALGRKIRQIDPDSGTAYFEYNALGELTAQQDADGNRIENEIDARGRVWRKTVRKADGTVESQSTYTFDTAPNGVGQLAAEAIAGTYGDWTGQSGVALDFSRGYSFDTLGRPLGSTTIIDGVSYPTALQYDAFGRPWKAQDASGRWIKTVFSNRGMAESVCESSATDTAVVCPADANTYLRTLETDAWGHTVRERRGNNAAMDVVRSYYADTGRVSDICAGDVTCNLMDEGYGWDHAGNLNTLRKEGRTVETFQYDSLNRLTQGLLVSQGSTTLNQVTQAWVYDKLGNICQKTEWGATYGYDYLGRAGCGTGGLPGTGTASGFGTHQVGSIGVTYMSYDNRGNEVAQTRTDTPGTIRDRYIHYSLDDKAYEIDLGNTTSPIQRTRFWYGSDGQRYKREDGARRTLYLGNVEIVTEGGLTTFKRNIGGVALQTVIDGIATSYYLFQDQLGSLARITDAAGKVTSIEDYNAFGVRRNPNDPHAYTDVSPNLTARGFTGQEHIDNSFVVHLNGRLYSAEIGRFLQADPVIQAPENTQSWNAYTYAFNNPYVYTDPTGMIGQTERQWAGMIVVIVAAVISQQYYLIAEYAAAFGVAVAGAFIGGAIMSHSLSGGLTSAFGAALTFGIGVAGWGQWQTIAAQAVTGGVIESLQGGNFGHGVLSAGLTALAMPAVGRIGNNLGRTVVGALVGGTISAVTGGKFGNGAISGAIQAALAKPKVVEAPDEGDETWVDLDKQKNSERLSDLDRAVHRFARCLSSGAMRNDSVWDYLYDLYDNRDVDGLTEQFSYRSSGGRGFSVLPGGERVAAMASAPLWIYSGGNWVGGPINFYRGAMFGDDVDDALVFAHEVLHRSPVFASQWASAPNSDVANQIHNEMEIHLQRLRVLLEGVCK